MLWIAPSEKDPNNAALEKRLLCPAVGQFRANSGLKSWEYSATGLEGGVCHGRNVKTHFDRGTPVW